MKVFQLQSFGVEHLQRIEVPDPQPGPGDVLIRIRAAALNRRDLLMILGKYDPSQPLPLIPLSDGAGEVVAIGTGVTRVQVGDRVAGIFAQKWLAGKLIPEAHASTLGGPLPGMLAEYAVLNEEGVVRVPDHLSWEEAATLPCAAVTAWTSLVTDGHLQPGETVLVQGTGGVALFALQFAYLAGARVIVLSSSEAKLKKASRLGAWMGIDSRAHTDWERVVLDATAGRGVDHVIEIGGATTFTRSVRACAPNGKIWVVGFLGGNLPQLDLFTALRRKLQIRGTFVGPRDSFEAMNRAIAVAEMHPVIEAVFPFEESVQALQSLRSGDRFGKTVIRIA